MAPEKLPLRFVVSLEVAALSPTVFAALPKLRKKMNDVSVCSLLEPDHGNTVFVLYDVHFS